MYVLNEPEVNEWCLNMLLVKLYSLTGNHAWMYGVYENYTVATPSATNTVYEPGSSIDASRIVMPEQNWILENISHATTGYISVS